MNNQNKIDEIIGKVSIRDVAKCISEQIIDMGIRVVKYNTAKNSGEIDRLIRNGWGARLTGDNKLFLLSPDPTYHNVYDCEHDKLVAKGRGTIDFKQR